MTPARPDLAAVGPTDPGRTDLTSAFGDSAAGALRGLLAPRPAPVRAVDDPDDRPDGSEHDTNAREDPTVHQPREPSESETSPRAHSGRPARSGAGGAPHAPRRARRTRVRDRKDIDLLLLAVARDGVANGRQFIELVRERSRGAFELTERGVYHELHRLKNNRLIARTGEGRYVLTELGERILASRTRDWRAYARAMNRVLGPDDQDR